MEKTNHCTDSFKSYTEEQELRKLLELLCTLVPELERPGWLEAELLLPLRNADFYTRRQSLLIWDIYRIVLSQITETAMRAAIRYLQTGDEEEVMDHWASSLDRTLTDLYRVFTMSSLESFLERFQYCSTRRGIHEKV